MTMCYRDGTGGSSGTGANGCERHRARGTDLVHGGGKRGRHRAATPGKLAKVCASPGCSRTGTFKALDHGMGMTGKVPAESHCRPHQGGARPQHRQHGQALPNNADPKK